MTPDFRSTTISTLLIIIITFFYYISSASPVAIVTAKKVVCRCKTSQLCEDPAALMSVPTKGSANQKIGIFKITCKALLCVGVGLIKKTLS